MADGFGQGEGIITVVQRHPYPQVAEDVAGRMLAAFKRATESEPEPDVVVDDDALASEPEPEPVVVKKATRKKAT